MEAKPFEAHAKWIAVKKTFPYLMLIAALAGCLDSGDTQELDQEPLPDLQPVGNTTVSIEVDESDDLQRYTFDLARQSYNHSLARYAVVADESTHVELDWRIAMSTQEITDTCAAGAITHEGAPNGTARDLYANIMAISWGASSRTDTRVTVSGTGVGTPDFFPSRGGIPMEHRPTAQFNLMPGERIVVELGGGSPEYATQNGSVNNTWSVELLAIGSTHLEPLPPRQLACGLGTYQATGTLQAHAPFANGGLDVTSAFNSTNASTAVFNLRATTPGMRMHAQYLGQTITDAGLHGRSDDEPGDMAIVFERWAGTMFDAPWFFADVYWPASQTA